MWVATDHRDTYSQERGKVWYRRTHVKRTNSHRKGSQRQCCWDMSLRVPGASPVWLRTPTCPTDPAETRGGTRRELIPNRCKERWSFRRRCTCATKGDRIITPSCWETPSDPCLLWGDMMGGQWCQMWRKTQTHWGGQVFWDQGWLSPGQWPSFLHLKTCFFFSNSHSLVLDLNELSLLVGFLSVTTKSPFIEQLCTIYHYTLSAMRWSLTLCPAPREKVCGSPILYRGEETVKSICPYEFLLVHPR